MKTDLNGGLLGWLRDRQSTEVPPPFAIVRGPTHEPDQCEVLVGTEIDVYTVADLDPAVGMRHFAMVPFSHIHSRGYEAVDDRTPLRAFRVTACSTIQVDELATFGAAPELRMGDFDLTDDEFASRVAKVQSSAIARGEGANFVLSRSLHGTVPGFKTLDLLPLVRRLMLREQGAHWTFAAYIGGCSLVGASPELHLGMSDGCAEMTPISGTLPLPDGRIHPELLTAFLDDTKEIDELSMVLDEELKMMSGICEGLVRVSGPRLRQMSRVLHTEYAISGPTRLSAAEALGRSLFAPTVIGSPLQNACRVIARHEPEGRGYYAGVVADLRGGDEVVPPRLDSAIVIRTAVIGPAGEVSLRAGATVVRDSDPLGEAAETRAKAEGLLTALTTTQPEPGPTSTVTDLGPVAEQLRCRNEHLSTAWLSGSVVERRLVGIRILLLDCEDDFTSMLAALLRHEGAFVARAPVEELGDPYGYDLVLLGPGPGDPTRAEDPKIRAMRRAVDVCLTDQIPLVAVCLGHQVLAGELGLPLERHRFPRQGTQLEVPIRGALERCGFYNSFAAWSGTDRLLTPRVRGDVAVSRDPRTGEVVALHGCGFTSYQFHPESILTYRGRDLLIEACRHAQANAVSALQIEEVAS